MRECGGCNVCCYVAGVPALAKKPHALCRHVSGRGCSIVGSETRPAICNEFECSWLRGIGPEVGRPDKSGVMISINKLNGGVFAFVVETKPGAVTGTGREMVLAIAEKVEVPVVIASYGKLPPRDTGDRVAIKSALAVRARRMTGRHIEHLGAGVELHSLAVG